jgi:outer membrane protein assembly complex protein YaeT
MANVPRVALLAIPLCLPLAARAAPLDFEGQAVARVLFDPPTQPIPSSELVDLVSVHPDAPLRAIDIRASVERLHATGRYSDIVVHADQSPEGVVLRFETKGNWFVGRVSVDGVPDPPNKGQLVNATKLVLGGPFSNDDLQQATASVARKLEANGFFEARVDPKLEHDAATQQVAIDFRIDPGPRARLVEPTIRGIPPDQTPQVVNATHWKRFSGLIGWKSVSEQRVSQGLDRIRRHYAKRDFLQSRVALDSLEYNPSTQRARPELTINPGPRVNVRTEGAKVSAGRLRQLVPIFQEQSADRDLIVEGMRNLTEHFRARGYFEAQVDFSTGTTPEGGRSIIYSVDRGERFKLAALSVAGNSYFPPATVRERMSTIPATRIRFRQGRFSDSLVRGDLAAIRELYLESGFRDVKVSHTVAGHHRGKPNWLSLRIDIQEGQQWLVGRMEIEGVSEAHRPEIDRLVGLSPGQPYSEAALATDRDNILGYYFNNGYLGASFDWVAQPAAQPNRIDLKMIVTEGRQQLVRDFLISGLDTSDPDMVLRRIRLGPGEPLSQSRVVESQRRLYDLGVFARVDVAVQNPDGQEQGKYLLYQIEEARKYSVNFGFGAEIARIGGGTANFDSPAGEPGFSPRASFGISRTNFAGLGHTVSLQTRASRIQQRALATYLAPQFKGRDNITLTINGLYDLSYDVRTFAAKRLEGAIQLSQRLTRDFSVQGRFAYRRNTISNLAIDDSVIPIFSRPGRVGILSATLIQDRRDNPIDSRRGFHNTFDFGLASKVFASQTDHTRFLARNSSYHRVWKDVTFARSLSAGWISNLREGGAQGIPLPERFFSGGASAHRGFPDNQAGPRDLRTGFPLGGSALLTNNLELRFPLIGDTVGGVLFHDSGNVYSDLRAISLRVRQRNIEDFDYMVHAVGLGIRYRTPVGPVRIDFGYSMNSPRFQFEKRVGLVPVVPRTLVTQRINPLEFHFSLGQTF